MATSETKTCEVTKGFRSGICGRDAEYIVDCEDAFQILVPMCAHHAVSRLLAGDFVAISPVARVK